MLHVGRASFPQKDGQKITDTLNKKLIEHNHRMGENFLRYTSINNDLINLLSEGHEDSGNNKWDIKNAITMICEKLDTEFYKESVEDAPITPFTESNLKKIIRNDIKKIESLPYLEHIKYVKEVLLDYKYYLPQNTKYSFQHGTKIFANDKITTTRAINSIISMLFARDYLSIDSIILLRNYVINSPIANIYTFCKTLNTHPGNDLTSLFLSDYTLINDIINLYFGFDLDVDKNITYFEYKLEINGEFNIHIFDFYCMIIYLRYIIAIYLLLIESEQVENTNEGIIARALVRIYRAFSLMIYNYVYTKLSIFESICFLSLEIINDVSTYFHTIFTMDTLLDTFSLVSSCNASLGHKDYSQIINEIVNEALSMHKNGTNFDHIDFLEFFEKSKKYGQYFSKRGFKRNLSKGLKKMMTLNNINGIRGKGCYHKGYKRPRKKKEDS